MSDFRSALVLGVLVSASLGACTFQTIAGPTETPSEPEGLKPDVLAAVAFLQRLYDPEIGLIPMSDEGIRIVQDVEYPSSGVFWVYSDNFLAAKALEPYDSGLSQQIMEKVGDLPLPGYWEALFCEPIPEPPRVSTVITLQMTPEFVILSEDHNEGPALEGNYADVLIYRAINLRDLRLFEKARLMWDGIGVWDDATQADGLYASYKLALLLIGANVLRADLPERHGIEDQLWSMQQENGGITTFYDQELSAAGTASTETTSLAILSAAPAWHCDD